MTKQRGFTLIELLVVICTISVLAAIALPQYAYYRLRSFDTRALNDLKNAATAEEVYYASNEEYVDCVGIAQCEALLPGFRGLPDVNLAMTQVPSAGVVPEHFTGRSFHPKGEHKDAATAFMWNSNGGGLQ